MSPMTPQRYQRLREIFHRACEIPAERRIVFLDEQCGDDGDLRAEVESLLAHDGEAADAFHDEGLGFGRALIDNEATGAPENLPEQIGGYQIIRKIGEGGMGVVYEARQQKPQRRVALKVLRPGYTTESILRRFAQEAELLGRVQHPGIAHVYEAGTATTPSGEQPYFAMELVSGLPLSEYAARNKLDTRRRMELFAQVCDAVHHAHRRGIIHRDLKPANIMIVDAAASPNEHPPRDDAVQYDGAIADVTQKAGSNGYRIKILDFGIARATDADIKMTTIQTAIGQLIGTVPYMSPEQVGGDSTQLDARSDVYSLGVVLYELLA